VALLMTLTNQFVAAAVPIALAAMIFSTVVKSDGVIMVMMVLRGRRRFGCRRSGGRSGAGVPVTMMIAMMTLGRGRIDIVTVIAAIAIAIAIAIRIGATVPIRMRAGDSLKPKDPDRH
jgi:hypothetical protein